MNSALQAWASTREQIREWSWLKKTYTLIFALGFLISSFLFLTPMGETTREWMAQTVITTQHRDWAWMFVGKEKRDRMVAQLHLDRERMGTERQNFDMIKLSHKPKRSAEELIKVEDISSTYWKGKKMYVYDPRAIRVVVPAKQGEGERITSMVERTGALAGINGGGFVDPDGLGNGFAPIGFIMSGGELLYTDQDGSIPQHVVGFTKEGLLVVGKYTIDQLEEMGVSEAVMFYPRVIANGKPLITSGDGGWGRGPRTAIGQKEDGTVIIMVIDGRQTHSVGATLKELQDLMLEEGVVNAGFLDGGASSELVTQADGLITKPSSRYGERRLPSALLVFSDPEDYKANNPWKGVTKIDPGGAHDHPDFLKEQADLRAKGKLNPSPSPSPAATKTPGPSTGAGAGDASGSPAATGSAGGSAKPSPTAGASAGNGGGSAAPSPSSSGTAGGSTQPGAGASAAPGATAPSDPPTGQQQQLPSAQPGTASGQPGAAPTASAKPAAASTEPAAPSHAPAASQQAPAAPPASQAPAAVPSPKPGG